MMKSWTGLGSAGLLLLLGGGVSEVRAQQVDLLIREARVIDGTGSGWKVPSGTANFYFGADPADSTLWVVTEWDDKPVTG